MAAAIKRALKGARTPANRRGDTLRRSTMATPRNFTPMPVTAPAAGLDLPHARLLRHRALEVLCMTDARAKADAARALFEAVVAAETAGQAIGDTDTALAPAAGLGLAGPARAPGTGAAPEGGAPPLPAHPGGAGGDDSCPVPYRIQRDQPRAGCRVAFCRHAAAFLSRLAPGGERGGPAFHAAGRPSEHAGRRIWRLPGA